MGHGLLEGPFGGLVVLALVTLMLGVTVGGALYRNEIGGLLRRCADRLRPRRPLAAGPPIERIARDVRRVRAELLAPSPGMPMARRIGVWRAYDDLLAEACRALDVPNTLAGLPPGTERDAERLHLEHELETAGLRLTPRTRR